MSTVIIIGKGCNHKAFFIDLSTKVAAACSTEMWCFFRLHSGSYFPLATTLALWLSLHVANGAITGQDVDLRYLASPNGYKMLGSAAGEMTGSTVSDAGDFNKDGFGDIIVGASVATSASSAAAYVVFGKSSGSVLDINFATMVAGPTTGFRINGLNGACRVSGAGDINGDGAGDVVVGVASMNKAFVVFGVDKAITGYTVSDITATSMSSTVGFAIQGSSDYAGTSASRAGDVNGDGIDDLLVGAHYGDPPSIGGVSRENAGIVYVLFGRNVPGGASPFSDFWLPGMNGNTNKGFRIFGAVANDLLGASATSVSRAGDVNGDGIGDIVLGANSAAVEGKTGAGMAYVVFGRSVTLGAPSYTDIDLYYNISQSGTKGFKIYGATNYANTGFAVSAAGDVNGDGMDDVIVGAYGGSPTPILNSAGIAYIIYGRNTSAGAPAFNDIMLSSISTSPAVGFRILGAANSDSMGRAVSGAGDVNGDGVADLIVGAYLADPTTLTGGSNAGIAYVIFGRNVAAGAQAFYELQLASIKTGSTNGYRILGTALNDNLGYAVGRAGDVNGDGIDDVVVGAYVADPPNFINAGESYVIFGAISDPTSQPSSQPSRQPSAQPTAQPSNQPVSKPTLQPSVQPISRPTGQPSSQPSSQPSCQPFVRPSAQPTGQPSSRPSLQPSAQPSGQPSKQPDALPTSVPSSQPSMLPTMQPFGEPSGQPSSQPSSQPTDQPTSIPSVQPSSRPTRSPSAQPTLQPSEQPSGQPSCLPSSQPSSQPSVRPSAQPSSAPSSQPVSQPSSQPSAQPASTPTSQPSSLPSVQPSVRPTTQPSCQPSAQPTDIPSFQLSVQPSGQPSSQPSYQPSNQPSSPPSTFPSAQPSAQSTCLPSAQPSGQPSYQPSRQPSWQPGADSSSQPTSAPSARPTDSPPGEWSVEVSQISSLVSISSVFTWLDSNIWACGGNSSGMCVLLDSETGTAERQYDFPQSVYSSFNVATEGTIVLSGRAGGTKTQESSVATCSLVAEDLTCVVLNFGGIRFEAASYVPFPDVILYLGQYHTLPSVTIVDIRNDAVQTYTYTIFNLQSVQLSQAQSPPRFVGTFVAGTAVRSVGDTVNYIIAGVVRTEGILTAMRLYPKFGTILNQENLVEAMALEHIGPDSFIAGGLELSDGRGQNAYLLRVNSLFNSIAYCVRYQNIPLVGANNSSIDRRALSAKSSELKSFATSIALVENTLFMLIESTSNDAAENKTHVSVLRTSATTGAITKQVNIGTFSGSLSCSEITSVGLYLTVLCSHKPFHPESWNRSSVIFYVDRELSFKNLPPGFTRNEEITIVAGDVPFLRTVLPVSSTKANIVTSRSAFNTAGQSPTRRPSLAPTYGPTPEPSSAPSSQPSSSPTSAPSVSPQPSSQPSTSGPTNTKKPTVLPTTRPSLEPSLRPTTRPSEIPTRTPTARPTASPSAAPTITPSITPTTRPSKLPTTKPTRTPSWRPSLRPSQAPTVQPSDAQYLTLSERKDGNESMVIGVSVGSVLFLCLSCYALFRYKQHQIWKEVRAKRREEIFAYEATEAARVLRERAELMEEAEQAAARKVERRRIREMKLSAAKGVGAHAETPVISSTPVPVPLDFVLGAAPVQRSISQGSSDSSFLISSLHSSELSGYASYEVDSLVPSSADKCCDISPPLSTKESVDEGKEMDGVAHGDCDV